MKLFAFKLHPDAVVKNILVRPHSYGVIRWPVPTGEGCWSHSSQNFWEELGVYRQCVPQGISPVLSCCGHPFFSFKKKKFLVVELQCCVNFCCTAKCLRWYIYTLFPILFHYGLSHDIEYSLPCCTAGPYSWSILHIIQPSANCRPQLHPSLFPFASWQRQLYFWCLRASFCFVNNFLCVIVEILPISDVIYFCLSLIYLGW